MAINRQPREDLMREATAYHQRWKLRDANSLTIFVGVRSQGAWSIYFEEDPVYQFNADGKLRRAHFQEQNYAADQGKLNLLVRPNRGGHVLQTKVYCENNEQAICQDCLNRLQSLLQQIQTSAVQVVDAFPEAVDFQSKVSELIGRAVSDFGIADSPNA